MRNCNCIELRKKKGHPDYNIIKPTNYNNKIYLIYMEQEIRGNSLSIYIIYVIFYACTLIRHINKIKNICNFFTDYIL